jgi:BirA family biotin operon repressor/biotin-[acetyl-CoA-carboxylase] ligase
MWPCEWIETTESTQTEALRRLGRSAGGAFALWTTRQTSGLGSHGRRWHDSPDGGLAVSIAFPQPPRAEALSVWPLKTSLAAVRAIESCHPQLQGRLGVKWPNDVVVADAKLAGVLVSRQRCSGQWWLVAGIGINLRWMDPPDLDRPVTDLTSLGISHPQPGALVDALCRLMARLSSHGSLPEWSSGWRAEFAARDIFAGRPVRIVHPFDDRELGVGRNCGVTDTGELLLDTGQGQIRQLAVGEVSVRQATGTSVGSIGAASGHP